MNRRKTHKKYVEEVALLNKNIKVTGIYTKAINKIEHECLIDGTIWMTKPNNILSGKGCPTCGKKAVGLSKRLSHEEYVKRIYKINKNIEILDKYITSSVKIKCKCLIHNNEWYALPQSLLAGHGCPKCGGVYRMSTDEYISKVYDIDPNIEVLGAFKSMHKKIKHRCKVDGFEFYKTPSNIIHSKQGCPVCNESKGEREIRKYLCEKNINFIKEYVVIIHGKRRKYDFKAGDIFIEFDGGQHFKEIDFFNRDLEETKKVDNIKTKFVLNNGFKLIRISYSEISNITYILDKELKDCKNICVRYGKEYKE